MKFKKSGSSCKLRIYNRQWWTCVYPNWNNISSSCGYCMYNLNYPILLIPFSINFFLSQISPKDSLFPAPSCVMHYDGNSQVGEICLTVLKRSQMPTERKAFYIIYKCNFILNIYSLKLTYLISFLQILFSVWSFEQFLLYIRSSRTFHFHVNKYKITLSMIMNRKFHHVNVKRTLKFSNDLPQRQV